MKKLPIGEQSFQKIREQDMLYVDKTERIHELVMGSPYIFLSRPRRFGKSLTLSTIGHLFSGEQHLFEGLWVHDRWDWSQQLPVIKIPFNRIGYATLGLETALQQVVLEHAKKYNIPLEATKYDQQLQELILKLAQSHGPVVLLIDEYDKPLIDYLEKAELPTAYAHRKILKAFYGSLKDDAVQKAMRFLMITGVSKFSQVSIFSDLNYLDDVTFGKSQNTMVGYTQAELEQFFPEHLESLQGNFPEYSPEQLLEQIRMWYNGYRWNGETTVYNPFSILLLFQHQEFRDYWFKTGTPTFLMTKIREARTFELNDLRVNQSLFESYDLENMDVRSLLFQTGYLTVKHYDRSRRIYTLDYPNREVEESMHNHLMALLLHRQPADSTGPVLLLNEAFQGNDPARAVMVINSMLKDVPTLLLDAKDEHFYHALVHLLFRYLGLFIDSEVHTSDGRMDAVVKTAEHIFILEFKLDESAEAAMQQIRDKDYAARYRLDGKAMVGMGINFGSGRKSVEGWKAEALD